MMRKQKNFKKKTLLIDFFGKWPEKKELDKIEKNIYKIRKKSKIRNITLM